MSFTGSNPRFLSVRLQETGGGTDLINMAAPASLAGAYSFILPPDMGSAGEFLTTDGTNADWGTPTGALDAPLDAKNYSIACSVGSSALTITLNDKAGSTPSGGSPCIFGFRNATPATGDYTTVSVTAATTLVVSSGSTLGNLSGVATYLYVYAINNAGTAELAISTKRFDDGSIVSTTAEGGAGAADSATTIYSTTARSNVPVRLIARLLSNQTTAGTWAAVPTEISLGSTFLTDPQVGMTSGIVVPDGYVNQYINSTATSMGLVVGGSFYYNATPGGGPFQLPPGIWDLKGRVRLTLATAITTFSQFDCFFSTSSGNNTTGAVFENTYSNSIAGLFNAVPFTYETPLWRVNVTVTTDYYLKVYAIFSTGSTNPSIDTAMIEARRVG